MDAVCGNIINSAATERVLTDCSTPCSGDEDEVCGGPNRINVYWDGVTPPAESVTNPGPEGWASMGCFS